MGRLKKVFIMRIDALVIYIIACVFIVLLYTIFGYTKAFFSTYRSVQWLFTVGQVICVFLGISVLAMVYFQFKKTGKFAFYQNGIINYQTQESFYYHDIIYYEFVPQNNKNARTLVFKTDDGREGELTGLLPSEAFMMFQDDHAAIWGPFMIERIKSKQLFHVTVQEDTTSFKWLTAPNEDKQFVVSHQGIVVYGQFYPWQNLSRYQVSWNGMFSIKDTQNRTIFLEPSTSLSHYRLLIEVLDYFITTKENEESHE